MLKRLYHAIAWMALANLFAVGGLVGYLVASGRLNTERINQIALVLRGEFPKPPVQSTQPALVEEELQTSQEELARAEAQRRFYEMVSDRHRRDLEDRNALNQTIQMDVTRQLEQIQTKEQEITKQQEQVQQAAEQGGFQQSLEILSEMEPKLAKDVLRTRKPADAVQILMQMESGRRKKIINTCKTSEEKTWIADLLQRMRAPDAGGSAALAPADAGKTGVPSAAVQANAAGVTPLPGAK